MADKPGQPAVDEREHGQLLERLQETARTFVRPTITLILVSVGSYMVAYALDVPEWYRTLIVSVVSFWFGSRSGNGK